MKKQVYLCPAYNGRYVPHIALFKPSEDAVLLTAIGEYPTTLRWLCFDAYGQGHFSECDINSETELMQRLHGCGDCQCAIAKLWDLDINQEYSDEIGDLFDCAYEGRGREIRGEPVSLDELHLQPPYEGECPFPDSDNDTSSKNTAI